MKYIGVIGKSSLAQKYFKLLSLSVSLKMIVGRPNTNDFTTFHMQKHPLNDSPKELLLQNLDYIFICDDSKELETQIQSLTLHTNVKVLTKEILDIIFPLLNTGTRQIQNLELILNNIGDGLIVVNDQEQIQFMNQAASEIVEVERSFAQNKPIKQVIKNTRLPKVLQSQQKEVNQKFPLENNKVIVTTRVPLINELNHLVGAFAIFKDSHEVLKLAEENTDLTEIKTMLEAIIHSSEEAISVVDEYGNGLMINPAYTRITGLTEKEVINQPATVDISEGESMHFHVLKTRRPVRGAKMRVGPHKKEVLVNVAPIIVEGKLKGSVAVIHDMSEIKELTFELKKAKQMIRNLEATYTFSDIIGDSPEMMIAIEQAKIGAKTPATVLLRGDSGTGKELFAHAIHNESERKYNKFIRVNCAALAESVLESELFGYEEGAFTGAKAGGKKGLFEEANMGSIFLDEIGELSLQMQAKLLRVLQEKEILRVGGTTPIPIDVRIITATNINLERAITNKEFREDLYYRLNRLPIYIPSLQERIDDLAGLTDHMIAKVNQVYGRNVTSISEEALQILRHYPWPGNVRELENVISRAVIFMDVTEGEIKSHHLPDLQPKKELVHHPVQMEDTQGLQAATENFEKGFIQRIYKENKYNKTETAKQLQISIRNLYYKLEKYKLE